MKLIQITDFHLFSKKQKKLNNVTTYDGFKKTIKYIKKNEKNIDEILVTGDVSEDGSIESYELAIDEIKNFKKNIYFIHGNHDDKKNINMIFYKEKFVKKIEELNHKSWDFIEINTVKEGYDFGFITEKELINIDNKLLISKKFNKKSRLNYASSSISSWNPFNR